MSLDIAMVLRLIDQYSKPLRAAGKATKEFARGVASGIGGKLSKVDFAKAYEDQSARVTRARQRLTGALGAALTLALPIREAIKFEAAMADVRKVVDFETPKAFAQMGKDILSLTKRLPMSAEGIADIVAAAGQAGFARDELLKFAEMAAKIGVAFDITADQAGTAMAKLRTGLEMSVEETGLLADAMNHLSNKMASSAPEILDVLRRVAVDAKKFGLNATEVSAFASAMIAAGAQSEVAATSFRNMGIALTMGASATKRQHRAFKELGLDATVIAKRMQEDAAGTILDVFERLAQLPKEIQARVGTDLFGKEARAIGLLTGNTDLLRKALGLVVDPAKFAGSAMREYSERAKTTANNLQLAKNRAAAMAITFGNILLPSLNTSLGTFGEITDAIGAFAEANPKLTDGLVKGAAGLLAFSVASRVARFFFEGARLGVLGLIVSLQKLSKIGSLAGLLVGGGAAAGLGALAAIAAAGYLIWRYWDQIGAFFSGAASAIGDELAPAIKAVKPYVAWLAPAGDAIAAAWSGLGEMFSSVVAWFGRLANPVKTTRAELESAKAMGEQFGHALVKTFTRPLDAINDLMVSVGGLGNSIVKEFTGIDLAETGTRILTSLWDGMKAAWEKMKVWVGEIGGNIASSLTSFLPDFGNLFGGDASAKGAPQAARGSGAGQTAPVVNNETNNQISVSAKVTVNNQSNATVARDAGRAVEQRVRRALDDAAVATN